MVVNKKGLTCFIGQIILRIESGGDQVSPLILSITLRPINVLINPDLEPLKHTTICQAVTKRLFLHIGVALQEIQEELAE